MSAELVKQLVLKCNRCERIVCDRLELYITSNYELIIKGICRHCGASNEFFITMKVLHSACQYLWRLKQQTELKEEGDAPMSQCPKCGSSNTRKEGEALVCRACDYTLPSAGKPSTEKPSAAEVASRLLDDLFSKDKKRRRTE